MDRSVAFAAWVNSETSTVEVVGIPVKTIRGKVTLTRRHPAFARARLDIETTDFDPAAALQRFLNQRRLVVQLHQARVTEAQSEVKAIEAALASHTYSTIVLGA